MSSRALIAALILAFATSVARADDLRSKYVGRSSCAKELWGPTGNYGIRLDRTQHAYLAAHTVDGVNILAIVKYDKEGEKCGVIKDVVGSKSPKNHFEFDCVDCRAPSDVVIGTWPAKNLGTSGTAVEAWKIDLKQLRFLPIVGRVRCIRRDYTGSDKGYDLVGWGRRALQKNCPEPQR